MTFILQANLAWMTSQSVTSMRLDVADLLRGSTRLSPFWSIVGAGPMVEGEMPKDYSIAQLRIDIEILYRLGANGTLLIATDEEVGITDWSPLLRVQLTNNRPTWSYVQPDMLLHTLESHWITFTPTEK